METRFQTTPVFHSNPYVTNGVKPMYELCIDTVGPFPRDEEGFMYIVVIIDSFTRYVTLHRCKDTTARAAGTALFDHCCIYGVSKVIHTDNESQYVNALISTLTNLFYVKHNLSIAYSSQINK
jgi:transposase InsO family protein